ncbi:MAG: tetratricopeptide repeat protein, partial [Chitinophagaceae bacterium]
MQKGTFILALLIYGFSLTAQQTRPFSDPDALYEEAQTYFQQELYSLAYPLLKELELQLRLSDRSSRATLYQQIKYYTLVCGLKQNEPGAALQAEDFITIEDHAARVEQMSFHLGEYYFRRGDYTLALEHYGQTSVQHLSNREVADYKFHQGYAYFSQQKYDLAKPLFNVIRQVKSDPNYAAANYYFGFISFYDKEYASALKALEVVENHPEFGKAAPYFISVIRFMQGQKQEAFDYAEKRLSKSGQLYEREMQQLVGHGYYLQQQFEKALPFLEQFAAKTPRRSRADIFELAYCQYKTGRVNPAIEGFRQLSGKEDSLAQQAMYVLGDLYLKKGEKENARNAFLFCSSNSSNTVQREISMLNYAKLSFELGYQDIALSEYQEFLETYPQSAYAQEAREGLVRVLANTNNYKEALSLLESIQSPSAEAMKSYPRVLYGRATEFINDGALPAAEALLTKAETFSGNAEQLPFIYYWKGELAYRRGQVDEAIRYFQNYLKSPQAQAEVNPLQAKYNLAYCYLKKENYSKAKPLFDEVGGTGRAETQAWQRDAFLRSAD